VDNGNIMLNQLLNGDTRRGTKPGIGHREADGNVPDRQP